MSEHQTTLQDRIERKNKTIMRTIENLIRELKDGPLTISAKAVDSDFFLGASLAVMQSGNYGITVQCFKDKFILKRKAEVVKP